MVTVLAPSPLLTITLENRPDESEVPEVHLHAGGQGLWVARMAYSLGARVHLCAGFGGETGQVLPTLAAAEGVQVHQVGTAHPNSVHVYDRRGGERTLLAEVPPWPLDRHELDDLYGTVLARALESQVCVLAGTDPATLVDPSIYSRLVEDLAANGTPVVADLSGPQLEAVLPGRPAVLKISHEELVDSGRAESGEVPDLVRGMCSLVHDGARTVVCSRAAEPTLVLAGEQLLELTPPPLQVVEHRGAGDSMTAGLAVGTARALPLPDVLRLAAAAGALNTTRRGFATGRGDEVTALTERVRLRELDLPVALR